MSGGPVAAARHAGTRADEIAERRAKLSNPCVFGGFEEFPL
jgi:hypothetical protein